MKKKITVTLDEETARAIFMGREPRPLRKPGDRLPERDALHERDGGPE